MQRLGGRITLFPGQITKGHNSHQALLAIQYRQTVYLLVAHAFRRSICDLIVKNVLNPARHHVAYLATIRRLSFRDATKRDVAVGDHADQAVVFPDGKNATVNLRHKSGCFLDRIVRTSLLMTSRTFMRVFSLLGPDGYESLPGDQGSLNFDAILHVAEPSIRRSL
jgi:hypothetical protein